MNPFSEALGFIMQKTKRPQRNYAAAFFIERKTTQLTIKNRTANHMWACSPHGNDLLDG